MKVLATILMALTMSGAASAATPSNYEQRLIDRIDKEWPRRAEWRNIAQCETGGDWQWNSGTFQGGLGFHYDSWDAFRYEGYPSEAYNATVLQQMVVGERIWERYGLSGWGCRGWA